MSSLWNGGEPDGNAPVVLLGLICNGTILNTCIACDFTTAVALAGGKRI